MSRLKFSSNLFLEVNELQRFNKFLEEDGWKRAMKAISKNFGIVENASNSYFKVTPRAGSNSVIVINAGIAFDSNMDAIVMTDDLELSVGNTGSNRWVILSRAVTNEEQGTVSINSDGSLSGIGTEFTKVLRGQPNFPVKVKFNSTRNNGEYEVVSVTSDTSALLSGSFVNQSNIKYSVVGTFTPGFQPTEDNKMIYEYDSYNIEVVDSEDRPAVSEDEFILAMISFDASGSMNVSDERIRYMFNNPYTQSDESDNSTDPLVSLLSTGVVGGIHAVGSAAAEFELIMEHGYTVTRHELLTTSTSNTFNIISGQSNFLGTGNIPDGMFRGWLLVNRANMKYALIDDNSNKSLYISNFDTSIILDSGNDFIIVPNCNEIEYEVTVSNNVDRPNIPFYFRSSIWNLYTRAKVHAFYPSNDVENFDNQVTITIKYRLMDNSGNQQPFSNLAIAQFENVNGQTETLSESSFVVDLTTIEPEAKQRNYS
jgi:hypothetical protein|nr:MAG TPA: hypothetical protein [Caudoviricetes sp.]